MTYDPNNHYDQQQPNNYQQPGGGQQPMSINPDAKNMAVFAHLSSILAMLISLTTLSFIAPLIFWFIYKDKPGYEFTKESSRRAFNFNFSMWIINAAAFVLIILSLGLLGLILWVVPVVIAILMIIFHVLGALAASRGELYDYPMTFIKILK